MPPLRRQFADRDDLARYLKEQFPNAPGRLATTRGGRTAALARLHAFEPTRYAATRNFLNGMVSHLSAYLRHGVLTLAEVHQHTKGKSAKFTQELAWRDYWRRVYAEIGNGVWEDQEPIKTHQDNYANDLPADLAEARTGLACIDAFARELVDEGTMHNHARMWFASYVVHWRRIRWQAGARWFLRHLLDGDPASNNLSWQWVASTFSSKPYIFNRENLEHYSNGRFCRTCPAAARCPFDRSYPGLDQELFPPRMIQWLTADHLRPQTGMPAIFVFDESHLDWSLQRIGFVYECLLELNCEIHRGNPVEEVAAFARAHQAKKIVTIRSLEPHEQQQAKQLAHDFEVEILEPEPFVEPKGRLPLGRFSRYWKKVEPLL